MEAKEIRKDKIITLYHGLDHNVGKPVFGKGKLYNDYGLGFYCTKSKELASEWSVTLDENNNPKDGFLNVYELDLTGLNVLNINNSEYPMLSWLSILLENRTFDSYTQVRTHAKEYLNNNYMIDYKNADLLIGYRADDSYFQFAKDFLDGLIPYSTLCNAMMLGELGNQYVLKSKKAFENIRFCLSKSEKIKADVYYSRKREREEKARKSYFESKKIKLKDDDFFITDLIRGRITENDKAILRQRIPGCSSERNRSDD